MDFFRTEDFHQIFQHAGGGVFPAGKLFKGENLAVSSGFTAQEFFDAWKNSDQHNKNMLNPNYKTVSISIFVASTTNPYANKTGYYNYGIQNFGK